MELTVVVTGPGKVVIDWGDGSETDIYFLGDDLTEQFSHTYAVDGVYDVSVTGTCKDFKVSSESVTEVKDFGSLGCNYYGFMDCINLTKVPAELPSSVTSLRETFMYCDSFNDPSVSNWNTANVTDFAGTFRTSGFNQPLNWDTSNGVDFSRCFREARSFNQSIDGFDFSSAADLTEFLYETDLFNQPVNIVAPLATSVSGMLGGAIAFNSPISMTQMTSCSNWSELFQFARVFDQPLTNLDTSAGNNFDFFLNGANVFAQDLSSFNVGLVSTEPTDFSTGTLMTPEQQPNWPG